MLRVLIVDDEPIVRLAVREMIQWESFQCEIIGEAGNGKEALQIVQQGEVDLVLIDIQMPIMNGVEFIKCLQQLEARNVGVIVLSAYSHYNYVREAFLYGAMDYIIKDELGSEQVCEVIRKSVGRLQEQLNDSERRQREKRVTIQRERERFLLKTLRNKPPSPPGETGGQRISDWLREIGGRRQLLVSVLIDREYARKLAGEDESKIRFIIHTIHQVIEGYGCPPYIVQVNAAELAMLLLPPVRSELDARKLLDEMLHKAATHIREYVGVTAAFGVSGPCGDMSRWAENYRHACFSAQLRFFYGTGYVFFAEDRAAAASTTHVPLGGVWNVPLLIRQLEGGQDGWQQELARGLEQLAVCREEPIDHILQPYRMFLWELGALLYAHGLTWEQAADETAPEERLESLSTVAAINDWFGNLVGRVAHAVHPSRRIASTAPRVVDKVRQWIDDHSHEPISLQAASEMAGISENYLSKIFAREMGETFVEYLTRRRVEKAIQMMESGMKIYEIAEKAGYPNQGHFSKVFKKVTGQTPGEYRDQAQRQRRH